MLCNTRYYEGLSVPLSVCLSNTWIVTEERKQLVPTFLYRMEGGSSSFMTRRMVGGANTSKFWTKLTLLERRR